MTEGRAWVDMGRDYVRRDEQWDAAPTADDLAELAEDGTPGDDAPDGGTEEPQTVTYWEQGQRRVLRLDVACIELPF